MCEGRSLFFIKAWDQKLCPNVHSVLKQQSSVAFSIVFYRVLGQVQKVRKMALAVRSIFHTSHALHPPRLFKEQWHGWRSKRCKWLSYPHLKRIFKGNKTDISLSVPPVQYLGCAISDKSYRFWQFDVCLTTHWWQLDDCLVNAWQKPDDYLTTACQLPDNCLMTV